MRVLMTKRIYGFLLGWTKKRAEVGHLLLKPRIDAIACRRVKNRLQAIARHFHLHGDLSIACGIETTQFAAVGTHVELVESSRGSCMHERMLWIEVKAIKAERRVMIGIKHKVVEHYCTIDVERALNDIVTLGMATLPALAGSKDREGEEEERKSSFH